MVPCVKYIFVQKPLRVDDSVHFKMFNEPRAHWLHNCRSTTVLGGQTEDFVGEDEGSDIRDQ